MPATPSEPDVTRPVLWDSVPWLLTKMICMGNNEKVILTGLFTINTLAASAVNPMDGDAKIIEIKKKEPIRMNIGRCPKFWAEWKQLFILMPSLLSL